MSNDNGLIDELEKVEKLKAELEQKEEDLKKKIVELAQQKNTEVLFGNNKKCFIKAYDKIVYPEDKTLIISLMKQKGIYDKFSMINYMGLNSAIIKGSVAQEVVDLVKREKAFRVSLKDK